MGERTSFEVPLYINELQLSDPRWNEVAHNGYLQGDDRLKTTHYGMQLELYQILPFKPLSVNSGLFS